ncbi:Peptidase M48 [Phaffia rhodozyma]|uniref:Peptidase M48 n=1 Tax=Phaffia rhodozyma TaxID=264483 RepID=A0A0F7SFY1_PHARH|nr:Peptidase M48 [Phaffia rhodozyma]
MKAPTDSFSDTKDRSPEDGQIQASTSSAHPARSPSTESHPVSAFSSSTVLAAVTTLTRILVSIAPSFLVGHWKTRRRLKAFNPEHEWYLRFRPIVSPEANAIYESGKPVPEGVSDDVKRDLTRLAQWAAHEADLRKTNDVLVKLIWAALGIPLALLALVILSGLERVPLTGRWRLILLSPSEEDSIHDSLKEQGWFPSVLSLLMLDPSAPPPKILDAADWRWAWVESTLRQLEKGAGECHELYSTSAEMKGKPRSAKLSLEEKHSIEAYPPAPPPTFPLHPRPRASQLLHEHLSNFTNTQCPSNPGQTSTSDNPELEGPPFSLLLIENKEANAFSYGFGGNGAAGIVIYTGLLDEILSFKPSSITEEVSPAAPFLAGPLSPTDSSQSSTSPNSPTPTPSALATAPTQPSPSTLTTESTQSKSLLSFFFGDAFSTLLAKPSSSPTSGPTEEQTLHLAAILAHEMSHLLLSHHLETLSQTSVVLPSMMGLLIDLARAALFPITFVFGPLFNDAIANFGKMSTSTIKTATENCSNQVLEIEADLVGLRILAHSQRFNPYKAAQFWLPSRAPTGVRESPDKSWFAAWRGIGLSDTASTIARNESHPRDELRKLAVDGELERWRKAWREKS